METYRLLALADELLVHITERLANDRQSLAKLAKTCTRMRAIAEPFIYRDISLRNCIEADQIAANVKARREIALAVHNLDNRISPRSRSSALSRPPDETNFNFLMKHLMNLRHWVIESPYANNSRWSGHRGVEWIQKDMQQIIEVFQQASPLGPLTEQPKTLPLLQSFTLHPHGRSTRYYRLDGLGAVFLHPSLRTIHMSCVVIADGLQYLQRYQHTTPLTTLILEECEVSDSGLSSVLCAPKSLTHLTLGENVHHTSNIYFRHATARVVRSYRMNLGEDQEVFIAALKQQAHSLHTFKHISQKASPLNGLNQLVELRKLELATGIDILELTKEETFLPTSLQELVVIDSQHSWAGHLDHVTSLPAAYWLKQLKSVTFVVPYHSNVPISSALWGSHGAQKLHKAAYELHTRCVCVRVLVQIASGPWIRPYLYGERDPVSVEVYNSQDYSFEARLGEEFPLEERRDKDELTDEEVKVLKSTTDRLMTDSASPVYHPYFPEFFSATSSDSDTGESADSEESDDIQDEESLEEA